MVPQVLTALSEPTRLSAMHILWDGGEHCVCELMERLDASQSRMSRHMATLKSAGIIIDRRDRQWVRYRINPDMPKAVYDIIAAVMTADTPPMNEAAA